MPLASGTRLGPYEILAPLGAGGMGEVYRARDTRLAREVAIKTLPAEVAGDREHRARFEREAMAIAALSHPNVMAIHDVGAEGDISFAVIELIEGLTLRDRLREGSLPAPRVIGFAIQIAQGLAAAHDKGVIHRDLKPENLIVTPDGRIKILDFGLARLEQANGDDATSLAPTQTLKTEAGAVLGTIAYMAPEQVRGQVADARSDIFALGAVMYEMVSGTRPFHGATDAETMSAILRDEPAELAAGAPAALERIIRRCLEKAPVERFRSTADLAFALEAIATQSSGSHTAASETAVRPIQPRFKRITYRNGFVASARFIPDGSGVVFGASWEGRPFEVFTARPGSPEARSLGLPPASLLSVSRSGEMAISVGYAYTFSNQVKGTLARNSLAGGGIRPLQKDVGHADWGPDGKSLAVIRYLEGRCRLEYPAGQLLVETSDWMSRTGVSRDGRHVAFAHHPFHGDSQGDIRVVDTDGRVRTLVEDMTSVSGIAWSPSGAEVWCSGINQDQQNGIWAVGLDGALREIYTSPARVSIHDVAADGRALIGLGNLRLGVSASTGDNDPEIDLSWFDGTVATDLSSDGSQVLLTEAHEAENPHYACYLRGVDGSPAVRLGDGTSTRFSPDGAWALATRTRPVQSVVAYPTGMGEPREIPTGDVRGITWAAFHPDNRHLFVVGSTADRVDRLFVMDESGGSPTLVWDEPIGFARVFGFAISPDGERAVFRTGAGNSMLLSVSARTAAPLAALGQDDTALRFDASGHFVFTINGGNVHRIDVASGERQLWRRLAPRDPTGILFLAPPAVTPDGSTIAYSYYRHISDLYLVEGLG